MEIFCIFVMVRFSVDCVHNLKMIGAFLQNLTFDDLSRSNVPKHMLYKEKKTKSWPYFLKEKRRAPAPTSRGLRCLLVRHCMPRLLHVLKVAMFLSRQIILSHNDIFHCCLFLHWVWAHTPSDTPSPTSHLPHQVQTPLTLVTFLVGSIQI